MKGLFVTRNGCRIVFERYGDGFAVTVTQKDAVREDVVQELLRLAGATDHAFADFSYAKGFEDGHDSHRAAVAELLKGKVLTSVGKSETYVLGADEAGGAGAMMSHIAGRSEESDLIEAVRAYIVKNQHADDADNEFVAMVEAMAVFGFPENDVANWKPRP